MSGMGITSTELNSSYFTSISHDFALRLVRLSPANGAEILADLLPLLFHVPHSKPKALRRDSCRLLARAVEAEEVRAVHVENAVGACISKAFSPRPSFGPAQKKQRFTHLSVGPKTFARASSFPANSAFRSLSERRVIVPLRETHGVK